MGVVAPVWALRCVRAVGDTTAPSRLGGRSRACSSLAEPDAVEGKDKRWLLQLFEVFEQLSSGRATPMELTEKNPLDVYVHRGEDDAWGLYCVSKCRMLALVMRQACARNEHHAVKCVLRPKDDQSFWGWQWNHFYDGGDGLCVSTAQVAAGSGEVCALGSMRKGENTASSPSSPRTSVTGMGVGRKSGGGSMPLTPRAAATAKKLVQRSVSSPVQSPRQGGFAHAAAAARAPLSPNGSASGGSSPGGKIGPTSRSVGAGR